MQQAEYVPTLVDLGPPIRLLDLTAAPSSPRFTEAIERTDEVVAARGAAGAGLIRPGG